MGVPTVNRGGRIMKILLTGATGIIGRATVPRLAAVGHDVAAVYRSDADGPWLEGLGRDP
jgi:uncharacterized protein YbjT (DUF2867 family)